MLDLHDSLTLTDGYQLAQSQPVVERVLIGSLGIQLLQVLLIHSLLLLLLNELSFCFSLQHEVLLRELRALFFDQVVLQGQLREMREQQEVLSEALEQLLVQKDLFHSVLGHAGLVVKALDWHPVAVLEHRSAVVGHDQDAGTEWEILLHILEVVSDFLIFNQFSQCSDVGETILGNLTWLHSSFITNNVRSFEHLEQPWFHLVSIVVLSWLESHFAERVGVESNAELEWKDGLEELLDEPGLIAVEAGEVNVEVTISQPLWRPLMHLAHQVIKQITRCHFISLQNDFENGEQLVGRLLELQLQLFLLLILRLQRFITHSREHAVQLIFVDLAVVEQV